MTAGIATSRPTAVATSASAMPAMTAVAPPAPPPVIAYNYFMKKVKEFSANAETIEAIILAHIKATHGGERKLRPVQQA
jgi:hypothetical protein